VGGQLLNDSLSLQASWDEDVEGTGGILASLRSCATTLSPIAPNLVLYIIYIHVFRSSSHSQIYMVLYGSICPATNTPSSGIPFAVACL